MRAILIVLAAAMLGGCGVKAIASPPQESAADLSIEATVSTARMLYQGRQFADAQATLAPIVQPSRLAEFTPAVRLGLLTLYAESAAWAGDLETAHSAWTLATHEPAAGAFEWSGRLNTAAQLGDVDDAYLAFGHLRQVAPNLVRSVQPDVLQLMVDESGELPNPEAAQRQLAQALRPGVEAPADLDLNPVWLHAAAAALEEGKTGEAASYAQLITSPQTMAELRADRRFDELVAADPGAYDVRALAAAQLTKAQSMAAAQPDRLEPKFMLATALYDLNRYSESLEVLDAGLATGLAGDEDPDVGRIVVARKATVLSELGRNDEAIAVASAACPGCGRESGFNRQEAHLLIGVNRPAEALQLLAPEDEAGLVGGAELAAMRACAYQRVGRRTEAASQLKLLAGESRRDPDAVLGGFLCAGSDDQVAATVIALLDDPSTRDAALGCLQTYREGELPPLTQALRTRLAAVVARPDVQTALNKVGRVESYDMPRWAIVG